MRGVEPSRAELGGGIAAFAGYLSWGLVPLFWKQLQAVEAGELIAHRLVWSLVFVLAILAVRGALREVRSALATPRGWLLNLASGALLTVNWLVYVWGVNHGHVLECSLGYFLVPLLNAALGGVVLHERLRRWQAVALLCAAVGVGWQLWQLGRLPWIALALAGSFGTYGLLRKQSPLGPLVGLTVETTLIAPFAVAFLLWRQATGTAAFGTVDARTTALILSSGVVTAIPLLLFAYGARRLRLTTLGVLQYVSPTGHFLLGVWVYHEPFSTERLVAFGFIWIGLAIYTADTIIAARRGAQGRVTSPEPAIAGS